MVDLTCTGPLEPPSLYPKPATGRSLSLGTPVDPNGDRPTLDASRGDLWRPAPSFPGLNRGTAPASMFMGRVVRAIVRAPRYSAADRY